MKNNELPNGGFPPIYICTNKISKKIVKERTFQPTNNIPILKINEIIQTKKNKKKVININNNNNDESLEEV